MHRQVRDPAHNGETEVETWRARFRAADADVHTVFAAIARPSSGVKDQRCFFLARVRHWDLVAPRRSRAPRVRRWRQGPRGPGPSRLQVQASTRSKHSLDLRRSTRLGPAREAPVRDVDMRGVGPRGGSIVESAALARGARACAGLVARACVARARAGSVARARVGRRLKGASDVTGRRARRLGGALGPIN